MTRWRLPIPRPPDSGAGSPETAGPRGTLELAFREPPAAAVEVEEALAGLGDWPETLGLSPRIAARFPDADVEELRGIRRSQVARSLLLEAAAERVEEVADRKGIAIVFLKGMALIRGGLASPGARPMVDVDVLVAEGDDRLLWTTLVERGFRPAETPEAGPRHHHVRPLLWEAGGAVEIHHRVPGLTDRAVGEVLGVGNRVPGVPFLAAHAIAHVVAQERWSPWRGTLFSTVGDLIDLAGDSRLAATAKGCRELFARDVPPGEAEEVAALAEGLREGELPRRGSEGRRWLDYTLAGMGSPGFRRRVRVRALLEAIVNLEWDRIRRGLARWREVAG